MLLACALSIPLVSQSQMLKPAGAYCLASATPRSEARTIVSEDFSGFKAGSEEQPDQTNIANLRTGLIDASYTSSPGWTGAAIYQAGGKCLISTGMYSGDNGSYEDTGFLRSPIGDYAGDLTVKFSARLYDSQAKSDQMAVILSSVDGRIEAKMVDVTPEWNDFTVTFSKGRFEDCYIEITMKDEKVLIDDFSVKSVATSIPAPVATMATAFTTDGFTANWDVTEEADKYLLTLYKKDTDKAKTIIDFEDLNVLPDGLHLDATNPGTPEGWTITVSNGTGNHVSGKGYEGSQGIVIDADADGFITPYFDRDIRDFTFYARYLAGEPCFSQLRVFVSIDGSWQALGNIDIERISAEGEIINLSSRLPERVRQIKVQIKENTANDAGKDLSIVVDHISIMTDPESTPVYKDIEAVSSPYVFSGLDPETDYSYTVKAVNASFASFESNEVMALGLASPALLPVNDFINGGYTASWQALPKADGYVVTNYCVYTAPEDEEVTMLYEDFNKVTSGTLENPVGLYNSFNPKSLDEYTITPGWLGLCNYLVNGMMGTRSFFTAKGSIQTPTLDLSGNKGKFRVYLTLVGDSDAVGDSIVVQAGANVFQRQLISAHAEPLDFIFDFDCGDSAMPLLIYSYGGKPFYIDEISVTQNLEKGSQIFTETENKTIIGQDNCSVRFEGLTAGDNESFAFRVFAYRDFYGARIFSVSDAAMHVSSTSGIHDEILEDSDATVEYYNLQGVKVDRPENGVYIMRQGRKVSKVYVK